MRSIQIIIITSFITTLSFAQSIEKFSIDSGGASVSTGGIQVLYTIGEVHVAERTSAIVSVSEGFINSYDFSTLGIDDITISDNDIVIYPNPASDKINIRTDFELTKIEMYDVLGKQIFKALNINEINISNHDSGVYILKLYLFEVYVTKRIIIK